MNIRKEIFLGVRRQGFYKFRKPRSEQEINSLLDELNAYTNSIKYVYDKEINFIVLMDCRTNKNHFLSNNKLIIDAFNNYYGVKELKSNGYLYYTKSLKSMELFKKVKYLLEND